MLLSDRLLLRRLGLLRRVADLPVGADHNRLLGAKHSSGARRGPGRDHHGTRRRCARACVRRWRGGRRVRRIRVHHQLVGRFPEAADGLPSYGGVAQQAPVDVGVWKPTTCSQEQPVEWRVARFLSPSTGCSLSSNYGH